MNAFKQLDTIIFDFDGTLHDIKPLVLKINDDCIKKLSLEISDDFLMQQFGKTLVEVRFAFSKIFDEKEIDSFLDCYFSSLFKRVENGDNKLFSGTLETLNKLKNEGWKLALCTNAHTPFVNAYRKNFNLDKYFQSIYWAGKANGKIETKSEMISHILKELNSRGAIMIGDSAHDIQAAHDNDLITIGCRYGFGTLEELNQANYIIEDISELPELIKKIQEEL